MSKNGRRMPLNARRPRKASAVPEAGTNEHDRQLTAAVRQAAQVYNSALAAAKSHGLEVQAHLVEVESIGDLPLIVAPPIKLGEILRRYR